jgi:hypothetical protein
MFAVPSSLFFPSIEAPNATVSVTAGAAARGRMSRAIASALLAGIPLSLAASEALAGCGNITFFGTQPGGKPAFGQTVMVSGQVTDCGGRPAAGVDVFLWFSGRHGVQGWRICVRTDKNGRYTALMTIPRDWAWGIRGDATWVDLNVACPAIGVTKLFRVRNK